MKKFFAFLLCAAALATFAGCSDDDNEADLAQLIGKWECYKDYDGEYDEWDYDYGEGTDIYRLEFRADGTGACRTNDYTDIWIPFSYTLSGNMLAIASDRDPDYVEYIRIDTLTSSELVLAYDYEGDGGQHYTDKEYFKRMN